MEENERDGEEDGTATGGEVGEDCTGDELAVEARRTGGTAGRGDGDRAASVVDDEPDEPLVDDMDNTFVASAGSEWDTARVGRDGTAGNRVGGDRTGGVLGNGGEDFLTTAGRAAEDARRVAMLLSNRLMSVVVLSCGVDSGLGIARGRHEVG